MGIDAESAERNFLQYKFFVTQHREKKLPDMCKTLIQGGAFPNFGKLAAVSLALPLTSVPCERGFSAQNRVHTALRNALSVQNINNKLSISHEANQDDFDETESLSPL